MARAVPNAPCWVSCGISDPAHRVLHLHLPQDLQPYNAELLAPWDFATSFWLILGLGKQEIKILQTPSVCTSLLFFFQIWCRILSRILNDFEVSSPRAVLLLSQGGNQLLAQLSSSKTHHVTEWHMRSRLCGLLDTRFQGYSILMHIDSLTLLHLYQRCQTGTITP